MPQWAKSLVHHTIVDALCRFLKDCGFDKVDKEVKFWDPCREGTDKSRRVPGVVCTHPHSGKQYVVDARIFWNSLSSSSAGCTGSSLLFAGDAALCALGMTEVRRSGCKLSHELVQCANRTAGRSADDFSFRACVAHSAMSRAPVAPVYLNVSITHRP